MRTFLKKKICKMRRNNKSSWHLLVGRHAFGRRALEKEGRLPEDCQTFYCVFEPFAISPF